jgi:hypothetical protein
MAGKYTVVPIDENLNLDYPQCIDYLKSLGMKRPLTFSESIRAMVESYFSGDDSFYPEYSETLKNKGSMPYSLATCSAIVIKGVKDTEADIEIGIERKVKVLPVSEHLLNLQPDYYYTGCGGSGKLIKIFDKIFARTEFKGFLGNTAIWSDNIDYNKLNGKEVDKVRLKTKLQTFWHDEYSDLKGGAVKIAEARVFGDDFLKILIPDKKLLETHFAILQKRGYFTDTYWKPWEREFGGGYRMKCLLPLEVILFPNRCLGDALVDFTNNPHFIATDWSNVEAMQDAERTARKNNLEIAVDISREKGMRI